VTASRAGKTLSNGRYHLVEALGDGGMGTVWKTYDMLLERTVAVKELIPDRNVMENLAVKRERVRTEAVALAKVEHPVIVPIHDLLYEGREKNPWIVMAYVRGRSLDRIIEPHRSLDDERASGMPRPLEEQEAARIGLAVVHGLMACHERGIYHRDVKPANIIQCEDGSVRLVDFGIARIAGSATLTEGNLIIGTLEYLAPELLNGMPAGPATDLWSLGVTLYYALRGRTPFRADTQQAIIAGILGRKLAAPYPGGALAALVGRMLSKDPQERPDAAAVAATLRRIASGRPLTAPYPQQPGPALERTGNPPRPAELRPAGHRAAGTSTANLDPTRPLPPGRRTGDTQAGRPLSRLTPLGGLPVPDAARIVSDSSNDHAVADLLALPQERAASIINRCPEPAGGRLLGAIAAQHPGTAWKFLHILPKDRAGRLLDHMSSLAAAAVLSVPPARDKLDVLGKADPLTVVGALAEMAAERAAALVMAMDEEERGAQLLFQTANPVIVAAILRQVTPKARAQSLLALLPAEFRGLVITYLVQTAG
jgi:serine/threonine protein kinase